MNANKPLADAGAAEAGQIFDRPVRRANTPRKQAVSGLPPVDWSDVAVLIAVSETGSLRAAAARQRLAINTVRARLTRLEKAVGCAVIVRGTAGTTLTDIGARLCQAAHSLSDAPFWDEDGQNLLVPGALTLGCTEGVGTSWLTPRVADLAARLSPTTIDMQFDYDLHRDRSAHADLGLTYRRPTDPRLIVSKLATFHFLLFASPGYLNSHGTPRTVEELRSHSFVEQGGPGYNETAIDLLLGADRDRSFTKVRTNSSLTQAYAAANGAGIAILPSYTRAISSTLVPLPIVTNMRVPLYYFFHAAAKNSGVVRTAIEWLHEIFDPVRFPWFSDTFVHPDDFSGRQVHDAHVVDIFRHMIDRGAAR